MKFAVNTNGTEYTKKNRRILSMWRYWYGIGVVTMRSADLSASSTSWQSRKTSSAARSPRLPTLRWCSMMAVILDTHTFGRFHGSRDLNSSSSALSLTMSGTRGLPPRSRVMSSSSVTGPPSEYPWRCALTACRTKAYSRLVRRNSSMRSRASAASLETRLASTVRWLPVGFLVPPRRTGGGCARRKVAVATLRLRMPVCMAPSAALPW